jgi:hypothetical protein
MGFEALATLSIGVGADWRLPPLEAT